VAQSPVVQVALEEFVKLRDEIAGRSTAQWTVLGLNATVSAATVGFVLANHADRNLLLLLPLLTPALGLLFIDHALNIFQIGTYINDVLKPAIRKEIGSATLFGYEEWVRRWEHQTLWRLLSFGIPLVVLFTIVPLAALLSTFPAETTLSPIWFLWLAGVLFTVVEIGFWSWFFKRLLFG